MTYKPPPKKPNVRANDDDVERVARAAIETKQARGGFRTGELNPHEISGWANGSYGNGLEPIAGAEERELRDLSVSQVTASLRRLVKAGRMVELPKRYGLIRFTTPEIGAEIEDAKAKAEAADNDRRARWSQVSSELRRRGLQGPTDARPTNVAREIPLETIEKLLDLEASKAFFAQLRVRRDGQDHTFTYTDPDELKRDRHDFLLAGCEIEEVDRSVTGTVHSSPGGSET